jgi:hypothetical protein
MQGAAPIDSLLDILELIERIERQTDGLTRETFLQDPDAQDATAYRLLAIGEAAKGVDDDLSRVIRIFRGARSSVCAISSLTNILRVRARSSGRPFKRGCLNWQPSVVPNSRGSAGARSIRHLLDAVTRAVDLQLRARAGIALASTVISVEPEEPR